MGTHRRAHRAEAHETARLSMDMVALNQNSALQTETAECQTQGVEARLPPAAFSCSRQVRIGTAVSLQHEEVQGVEARPSPPTCMQTRQVSFECLKGWEARLPPKRSSTDTYKSRACRGINLVNAADDALVKTAINNILPRANRNIATPTSLVDARQPQDGGRVREPKKHSGNPPRQPADVRLGLCLRRNRGGGLPVIRDPAPGGLHEQRRGATSL